MSKPVGRNDYSFHTVKAVNPHEKIRPATGKYTIGDPSTPNGFGLGITKATGEGIVHDVLSKEESDAVLMRRAVIDAREEARSWQRRPAGDREKFEANAKPFVEFEKYKIRREIQIKNRIERERKPQKERQFLKDRY